MRSSARHSVHVFAWRLFHLLEGCFASVGRVRVILAHPRARFRRRLLWLELLISLRCRVLWGVGIVRYGGIIRAYLLLEDRDALMRAKSGASPKLQPSSKDLREGLRRGRRSYISEVSTTLELVRVARANGFEGFQAAPALVLAPGSIVGATMWRMPYP